jgi:uncharacterized protein with HEPN domain
MLTTNDHVRLEHILDAMSKIGEVLADVTELQFAHDWQKQLIVERLLEIIGEATAHLTPELRTTHPHVPWSKMVGLRNVVSHQYFRIDVKSIWQTAVHAIPPIQIEIQTILNTK